MKRYELPEGWEWKRLGDICGIAIGKTPKRSEPRYWGGNNLWATIGDLNNGVVTETKEHITDTAASEECKNRLVQVGTLLMSFKLSIGKMAFAGCDLYTNEAIAALPISDESVVDKKYLFWCLKVVTLDTEADEAAKGKTLNKAKLKRLEIPLPPLSEQRRIVGRIEEISRRVEEARGLQKEAIEKANSLLPAAIAEVMSRAEPEGWEWKRLGELVVDVQPGFACGKKSKTQGTPHLRMNNISSQGTLDLSLIWRVSIDALQKEKYALLNGDVVFTNTNSPKLVGRTALFNLDGEYVFSNHLTRIRPNGNVSPRWIALVLHRLWMEGYFESICKRWVNQAAVSKAKLLRVEIPLPPLSEQRRIVAYLDSVRIKAEELKREQQASQAELGKVIPSVLSKAFRGEL